MNLVKRIGLILTAIAPLLFACNPSLVQPPTIAVDAVSLPDNAVKGSTRAGAETNDTSPVTAVPIEAVRVYENSVTLPTYPYERYQTDAIDPLYRWPYKTFDVERFRIEAPKPETRTYRLLVLENAYLKLLLLPELGGRLWQVIHKPSGAPMFYQNQVVKPTHWGQARQRGWLGLGGLEWGLPVVEHGYDWGTPWEYSVLQEDDTQAVVKLSTPQDGRLLQATITIALPQDAAYFVITPAIRNVSKQPLAFSFWIDAMLAPGSGSQPSEQLRFVLPAARVTIHSTADPALPVPHQTIAWPLYSGRDLSRLGNWRQYLGFFESPAAQGPFAAVYDPAYDAGAVRIFPPQVARGSKIFALGWSEALDSDNYTDDHSQYVELHGGLAPTFFDQAHLAPGETVSWREVWYPVHGIAGLAFAGEVGALNVQPVGAGVRIGFYPTQALQGDLVVVVDGDEQARIPILAQAAIPVNQVVKLAKPPGGSITVRLEDRNGRILLEYER